MKLTIKETLGVSHGFSYLSNIANFRTWLHVPGKIKTVVLVAKYLVITTNRTALFPHQEKRLSPAAFLPSEFKRMFFAGCLSVELTIMPSTPVQSKPIGKKVLLTCRAQDDRGLISQLQWLDPNNKTIRNDDM